MTITLWSCLAALFLLSGCSDSGKPPNLVDAQFVIVAPARDTIHVKFDPSEYRLGAFNKYGRLNIPGRDEPLLQFINGEARTLSMVLHFDSRQEGRDVRLQTNRITNLMKIDTVLHAPPVLRFIWADFDFPCVIEKLDETYFSFFDNGNPSGAKLAVTLLRYSTVD